VVSEAVITRLRQVSMTSQFIETRFVVWRALRSATSNAIVAFTR
jgi:hypothetical protein